MTEHDDVIRLLREGRPQATEMELDQIKQRVRRRAGDPSRRKQSMKSRVAILSMLVAGMLFSTAGAGLAVKGEINNSQASVAQYGRSTPEGGVLPAEATNAPTTTSGTAGGVLPAEATNTQPTRQEAAATNSQLPFTGFAAIPVLLGGLALLTGGLVLRRRTRSE
jgi:hypothetical protein